MSSGRLRGSFCQTVTQFDRAKNLDIPHFTCHYLYKMCVPSMSLSTPTESFRKMSKIQIYFSEPKSG